MGNIALFAAAYSPSYFHRLIAPENLPNLVLCVIGAAGVIAAVCTLRVINRQTDATEKAAEAELLSARAVMNAERAWIEAIPENADIPPSVDNPSGVVLSKCSVRFVNNGKTPAFVFETGYRAVVQDREQPLPDIQPAYVEGAPSGSPLKEVSKWGGDGFPVQPGRYIIKDWIGTWCASAKRIHTGYDVFWVYGYVKYRDIFGHPRETWYSFRWNPGIGTDDPLTFTADGPKGYNRVK